MRKPVNLKKVALTLLGDALVVGGLGVLGLTYLPIIGAEIWYQIKSAKSQQYTLDAKAGRKDSIFARYLSKDPIAITPVNKSFALVIEKIDVNVPVVKDVSVVDEKAYIEALKNGVAHAVGSGLPGGKGNVYLFAHSSINFFQLGKYATAFNLLRKLEVGDKAHLFYENKDYTYEVIAKEKYPGWNTYPLYRPVLDPILTLQTCDPPGTTWDRLVVTAKLIEVK